MEEVKDYPDWNIWQADNLWHAVHESGHAVCGMTSEDDLYTVIDNFGKDNQ